MEAFGGGGGGGGRGATDSGKVNIIFNLLILLDSLASPSEQRFSFSVSGHVPSCVVHPSTMMLQLNADIVIRKTFKSVCQEKKKKRRRLASNYIVYTVI